MNPIALFSAPFWEGLERFQFRPRQGKAADTEAQMGEFKQLAEAECR